MHEGRIATSQHSAWLFAIACFLSAVSWFVVGQGASDEPYMSYRRYDAVVQLGVGTSLMALWCSFSLVVVLAVCTRRLPLWWLAVLLWAAVCLFYLSFSPSGYLEDMELYLLRNSTTAL